MDLGLHFLQRRFPHIGGVDFIVEVTDVAHHRAGLHGRQHVLVAYVGVARGGDDEIVLPEERLVDIGALSVFRPPL